MRDLEAAFRKPHDAWKNINPGVQEMPQPLHGQNKLWRMLATRIKHNAKKGVKQYAPVIGGRRRYHHRPLTSWLLSNGRTLTLTPDEKEAQTWNRLKKKRHPSMPRIYEVFGLHRQGSSSKKPWLWAIVHERLTWPIDDEWVMFLDTFFRWRAWQKDALKPATPGDMEEFLRFLIDPDVADPITVRRKRVEHVLPWKMTKERRKDITQRRRVIMRDQDLPAKIKWAKAALKFLHANNIKFRDLDVSNTARTHKGDRTVITNMAESRSVGKRPGRISKLRGRSDP